MELRRNAGSWVACLAAVATLACATDDPPTSELSKAAGSAVSRAAPRAPTPSTLPAPAADASVDELVAPIALYPDPLLAIVLPASTYPLDVVQADRFLDRLAQDKTLQPDPAWHESVRNLLNTPDVVRTMAANLEWTIRLGEQVVADPAEVMEAIQRFRRRTQGAGNLVSDDKQTVQTQDDIVAIQSADPKIVYVPQYDPEVVVLPAPAPPVSYYPTPYPWYYYPWGVGMWTSSVFFGATTAWAMGWAHHEIWHDVDWGDIGDIDFDRGDIDIDRGDLNVDNSVKNKFEGGRGQGDGQKPGGGQGERPGRPGGGQGAGAERPSQLPSQRPGGGDAWRPGGGGSAANRPSQLPSTRPSQRPGDAGYRPSTRPSRPTGGAGAAGSRPSTRPSGGYAGSGTRPSTRPAGGYGGSDRPSASLGARPSTYPSGGSGSRAGSFDGYGSSRDMGSYSSRGKSSRSGSYTGSRGSGSYSGSRGSGGYSGSGGSGGYSRGGGGYSGGGRGGGGGGGRGGGGRRR
jgi:hypothetical protein